VPSRREVDKFGRPIVVITDPGVGGPTRYRVIGDQLDVASSKVTFTENEDRPPRRVEQNRPPSHPGLNRPSGRPCGPCEEERGA
jgi:hypothetical protein